MTRIGHVAAQRRRERLQRLKRLRDTLKPPPVRPVAVTVNECSALLGVSTATLWRAVKTGQIKSRKLRDRVLIPYSEVERIVGIEPEAEGRS